MAIAPIKEMYVAFAAASLAMIGLRCCSGCTVVCGGDGCGRCHHGRSVACGGGDCGCVDDNGCEGGGHDVDGKGFDFSGDSLASVLEALAVAVAAALAVAFAVVTLVAAVGIAGMVAAATAVAVAAVVAVFVAVATMVR